jgi:hypothetical protein
MSRRLIISIAVLTLAFTCTLVSRASSQAGTDPPGIDPTHYWSYTALQPFIQPNQVLATDQFYPAFVPIYLDSMTHLLNWVHKNNSAVPDTFLHYTWWNITNKAALDPETPVVITNQFGQFPAQVHEVQFMLVPAWKNNPRPDSPQANHYLCYRADGPPPQTTFYDFVDEWRTDAQLPGPLQFLCTPCVKEHAGALYPPVDQNLHLAVYPIQPQSQLFYPFITDQFHSNPTPVEQFAPEWLFVPTLKQLIVTPTKKSTWGALKTHYR